MEDGLNSAAGTRLGVPYNREREGRGAPEVSHRTGQGRFGESGAATLADEIETNTAAWDQLSLFPDEPPAVRERSRRRGRLSGTTASILEVSLQATTLHRVRSAMLFQMSGRTEALHNLLWAKQERDFLHLDNALSALYPRGSEEKRLLDGMLLATPR